MQLTQTQRRQSDIAVKEFETSYSDLCRYLLWQEL